MLLLSRAASVVLLMGTASAWVSSSQQPRGRGARGSRPSRSAAVTRWDADLDRARDAHRKKQWTEVQQWCTRVIDIADDWNAIEQAHLRLALAEQKRTGADGGRRAFQHGIEHCPSSDTLMLAWALMESKIKNARSRKIAKALLRRAVALNPKKNSPVLRWAVFDDLDRVVEAAGGAAVQAVRSALSPGQQQQQQQQQPRGDHPLSSSPSAADQAAAALPATEVGSTSVSSMSVSTGVSTSVSSSSSSGGGCRRTTRAEEMEERVFATDLLELCRSNQALQKEGERQEEEEVRQENQDLPVVAAAIAPAVAPAVAPSPAAVKASAAPSARFEELAEELERRGGGVEGRGRELCGSWKLVFTTCTECDRLLTRTGSEVYQRLTPPIREIKSDPSYKHAAPFRCEVLLRPSSIPSSRRRRSSSAAPQLPPPPCTDEDAAGGASSKAAPKAGVAYFFCGWADHALPTGTPGDRRRGTLMQHVAPRSATVFSGDGAAKRAPPRVPSPTPPAAVFRALGRVARSGKGLEKLATQRVTYVGRQLRIGRTGEDVYVYERCAWPAGEIDEGLMV